MSRDVLAELGTRIRTHRHALGLSQEDLADRASLDRSYLGGVERGERNLTFTKLVQIADALECDLADLTTGLKD